MTGKAEAGLALAVYVYVCDVYVRLCVCVCVQTSKAEYAAWHTRGSRRAAGAALHSSPSTWLETGSLPLTPCRPGGLAWELPELPISASHHTQEHTTASGFTQPPGDSHSGPPHPCPSHPEPPPCPVQDLCLFQISSLQLTSSTDTEPQA